MCRPYYSALGHRTMLLITEMGGKCVSSEDASHLAGVLCMECWLRQRCRLSERQKTKRQTSAGQEPHGVAHVFLHIVRVRKASF